MKVLKKICIIIFTMITGGSLSFVITSPVICLIGIILHKVSPEKLILLFAISQYIIGIVGFILTVYLFIKVALKLKNNR